MSLILFEERTSCASAPRQPPGGTDSGGFDKNTRLSSVREKKGGILPVGIWSERGFSGNHSLVRPRTHDTHKHFSRK